MWTFYLLCIICTILSISVKASVGQDESNPLEIAKSKYGKDFKQGTSCGGHFESPAGVINYKVNEPLSRDGEACVWTILIPRKRTIQFRIIQDGFNRVCSNCEVLTYLKWENRETTTAHEISHHFYPNPPPVNITGDSFFQVVFTKLGPFGEESKGFSLLFEGIGPETNETGGSFKPVFNIVELDEPSQPSGQVEYLGDGQQGKWDFFMLTIHPQIDKVLVLTMEEMHNYVYNSFPIGCTTGILMVREYGWGAKMPVQRFSECRSNFVNSTSIKSQVPMQIYLFNEAAYYQSFKLSWRMEPVVCC